MPDAHRLRDFLVKQLNGGETPKREYRQLLQDEERWLSAVARASLGTGKLVGS